MNIYEFFQAAVDALQKYVLIHYDRDTWYQEWAGVSDVGEYYKTCAGSLWNDYFFFEWTVAAYQLMARRYTLYHCEQCGAVCDKYDHHVWCEDDLVAMTRDEAYEYFKGHDYPISDEELMDSLLGDGWEAFCAGTHKVTDRTRAEILECLTAIARDQGAEQLVGLTWALNIHHRNGSITMDYGTIDGPLLHAVQQYGLQDMFGEEEVNKFVSGGYPPIAIDLEKIKSLHKEAQ
jgi:hypothetical protein